MTDDTPDTPERPERPGRPDWLTGADAAFEGIEGAERPRVPERPRSISRPEGLVFREESRAQRTGADATPAPGDDGADPGKPRLRAWSARGSSIPTLRREGEPAAAGPPNRSVDDDFDPEPPPALERLIEATSRPAPAPRAALRAAPRAAWWEHALTAVLADRRLQLGVAVLAGIAAIALASAGVRHATTTRINDLRLHPEQFDAAAVTVEGRVGEVFPVADGWAFYLHQGRDTIVAFARTSMPRTREKIAFRGQVSTGFLDGQPRQALFELPPEEGEEP